MHITEYKQINVNRISKVDVWIDRHEDVHYSQATLEIAMPLILLIVALIALKYFEVGFVENISWWWVAGLGLIAFIWFEFLERMLGLDKRRAFDEMDKIREERVKKTFLKK